MIKQDFVRAFERGARRNHIPNIGLKTDTRYLTFDMEDSTFFRPPTVSRCEFAIPSVTREGSAVTCQASAMQRHLVQHVLVAFPA